MNKIITDQRHQFSSRVNDLHPSPIREILSVIDRPGMISFAGGLPAVESFPHMSLEGMPQPMLQYGASEGELELRQQIAQNLCERGLSCTEEQVLIISGSQQGIDLVAKLFIDEGTPVAVESPTYLAALQVFRFFGAQFVAYDSTQPDIDKLRTEKPAFAYTIPTFQNPSGHCLDTEQRELLAKTCDDIMLRSLKMTRTMTWFMTLVSVSQCVLHYSELRGFTKDLFLKVYPRRCVWAILSHLQN